MSTSQAKESVTVVVRGLPTGTSKDQLASLCSSLGGLLEVEIPGKAARKKRSSFGFLRFTNMEKAVAAIHQLNTSIVGGKVISAELGHYHPKNTNNITVPKHSAASNAIDSDENELSKEEIDSKVFQICHTQWENHRQTNSSRNLKSFDEILDTLERKLCLPEETTYDENM